MVNTAADRPQLSDFPRIVKGALVTLNPSLTTVTNTIAFQYNPETLSRSLQVQASDREGGSRSEVLRLEGAPIETIQLEAEFETTGPLQMGKEAVAATLGIAPQLAALETLIYPTSQWVKQNMEKARQGTLEIVPPEAPMTLFIWGVNRLLPVRLADFSITEEAYDINLNPIRAKVSLSLRVLNYNDLPWERGGEQLFLLHHKRKEQMAKTIRSSNLDALNISGVSGTSIAPLLVSPLLGS